MAGAIPLTDEVRIPANVVDLTSFRRWAHSRAFPERGRISFVAGKIEIDVSPEELSSHTKLKGDLYAGLHAFVAKHDLGDLLIDGAFLVNEAADLATEPDMTFCSWAALRQRRVRYVPAKPGSDRLVEVHGSPDLVVEIVSRSSVRKDAVRLRRAYFAARVREYWLIDARGTEIAFQVLSRAVRRFVPALPDRDGFVHSSVFDRRFLIVRDTNAVGGVCYRLLDRRPRARPPTDRRRSRPDS